MITVISYWDLFHFLISFFIDQFFQVYFKLLGILLLSYHLEKTLHDSICRNFIGLMWLDWIGLEWTWFYWIGLECGLFWMALHSNGQHRTALNRTSLDSPGLHWARNYAPDWNTPHCTSVGETGLDWNVLLHLAFMDLGCSEWKYTAIYLRGWDFTLVDETGLKWGLCTMQHEIQYHIKLCSTFVRGRQSASTGLYSIT